REGLVLEQRTESLAHPHRKRALRERRPHHPSRQLRHPTVIPGLQRHPAHPSLQRTERSCQPQRVDEAGLRISQRSPSGRGEVNSASADAPPGGVVEQAAQDYRTWLHELFFDLAQQAGATDAKSLAHQLILLYDGAGISAWLDRDPSAETAARAVAATLVEAAVPD
ncbi:hypothetical protein ABZT44_39895, partial [Streptomyces mirabilis]